MDAFCQVSSSLLHTSLCCFEYSIQTVFSADMLYAAAGEVYIDADGGDSSSSTTSRIAMRTMDALQGFKVLGTQKVEKALPVGTALTAIGEVVSNKPVGLPPFASACTFTHSHLASK